ncbi:hypothetical protein R4Z10_21520 (plasmid) [Niallia sp. XMNu-256]|uniref:hypothetical protein n=1 Tax=Niallia sp. XMNu-256 TaxID=3082444 RepID=UPI0030CDDD9A
MNCNCGGQYEYCNCGEQYQPEYRQSGGFGGFYRPCPPGWIDRGHYCCRMTCIPKRPRPTWGTGMGGMSPGMGGMSPGMGGMSPGMGGMSPGTGGVSPGMGGVSPGMGGISPHMGGPRPEEEIYFEDDYYY